MSLHKQLSDVKQATRFMFLITFLIIFPTCNVKCKKNNPQTLYIDDHQYLVESFNKKRQGLNTPSALGSILFLNKAPALNRTRKNTYVILLWKMSVIGIKLDGCSVRNCIFVSEKIYLPAADAVVMDLITYNLPTGAKRNPKQKWVFFTGEPPTKTFILTPKPPKLSDLANIFNWSMSYRSDSDVPTPFGRTVALPSPKWMNLTTLVPNWKIKRRDILATVLMSCCQYRPRMQFLQRLQKHLKFDLYGNCSKVHVDTCPSDFVHKDCKIISRYLFYLALENSRCPHYLSEKIFYNAYYKGAIPVIHGPTLEDCEKLLPPNSYLHADNFKTVQALAKKMIDISKDDEKLLAYHEWRNHFEVHNDHGYFGTKTAKWCRICEALNYNDLAPSVYTEDDIKQFLDPRILCKTYK